MALPLALPLEQRAIRRDGSTSSPSSSLLEELLEEAELKLEEEGDGDT